METNEHKAISMTEKIGAEATALGEWIERIHYDPEGITAEQLEDLEKILQKLIFANRLASDIAASCGTEE